MNGRAVALRDYILDLRDFHVLSRPEARRLAKDRARELGFPSCGVFLDVLWGATRNPASFALTVAGNAERFVSDHITDLRYCEGKDPYWVRWDGRRWVEAYDTHLLRLARQTIARTEKAAYRKQNRMKKEELLKHVRRSGRTSEFREVVRLAALESKIAITEAHFYADGHRRLLNCRNGIVDLPTGTLKPHDRFEYLRQLCPVDFDPDAKCPTWRKFLDEVTGGSKPFKRFLQDMAGYALTGETLLKALFFLAGPTNTGKSTFVEVVGMLLGDYASATGIATILKNHGREGHRSDLARLRDVRFVFASESAADHKLDTATVKLLTGGGDTIVVRHLHQSDFAFKPLFKLFIATNVLPHLPGDDDALWQRLHIVPFKHQPKEPDPQLMDKLKAELPGILAWAVRGAVRFYKRRGLSIPQEVIDETARLRAAIAPEHAFVQAKCAVGPHEWASAAALYDAWRNWAAEHGVPDPGHIAFGKLLSAMGYTGDRRRIGGRQVRIHQGIGIRN